MTKRPRTFVLAALLSAWAAACSSPPETPPPNILFVFADDHAYQAISAYGSKINQTPNIDRLASEGMRFDRCLVTNSICAPSRAVILSGKYSHLNGVLDNRLAFDGNQSTFPKLLQQAGYQTALIGKWHLKSDPTGFDHWEVLPGQGAYYNPDFRTREGAKTYPGHTTDITTDLALDWLENTRAPGQPFMLMYQHKARLTGIGCPASNTCRCSTARPCPNPKLSSTTTATVPPRPATRKWKSAAICLIPMI